MNSLLYYAETPLVKKLVKANNFIPHQMVVPMKSMGVAGVNAENYLSSKYTLSAKAQYAAQAGLELLVCVTLSGQLHTATMSAQALFLPSQAEQVERIDAQLKLIGDRRDAAAEAGDRYYNDVFDRAIASFAAKAMYNLAWVRYCPAAVLMHKYTGNGAIFRVRPYLPTGLTPGKGITKIDCTEVTQEDITYLRNILAPTIEYLEMITNNNGKL